MKTIIPGGKRGSYINGVSRPAKELRIFEDWMSGTVNGIGSHTVGCCVRDWREKHFYFAANTIVKPRATWCRKIKNLWKEKPCRY